jgi:hypothetical protein
MWLSFCFVLLTGCTSPALDRTEVDPGVPTVAANCWPGTSPPPQAVTDLARGQLITVGGTSTPMLMTTPTVPCTSVPIAPRLMSTSAAGQTPVLHPTQRPIISNGGSPLLTLLDMPSLDHVALAVHPAEGWAAVASDWPDDQNGSDGGPSHRIFVRVFNPHAHAWGIAQQVNPPPAEDGNGLAAGVALAITGDGTVHVVWGGAFTSGNPVWYAQSRDDGTTWSAPVTIGHDCSSVARMAATLDGQLVVLGLCTSPSGRGRIHPGFIVRRADGTWLPQDDVDVDGRSGSLVVLGDGPDARAVALVAGASSGNGFIIQKRLADPGPWQVQSKDLAPPSGLYADTASSYLFHGTAFRRPNGTDGIVFTWSVYGGNAVHALESLDGGQSWGPVETVAAYPSQESGDPPPDHRWSVPAYDARSDRLIIILVRRDLQITWPGNGTHYAFWSVPGSGVWRPRHIPGAYDPVIPLISGASSASDTDTAQAANGSYLWLAWIESYRQLKVRSIDLDLIVPPDQYPTPAHVPVPTTGAHP